jgi:glycosyltransferase involved in cell wall biosynthesis
MAIILDTESDSGATYMGYLERSLFTDLMATLPGDQFISTKSTDMQSLTSGIGVGDLPAQKGLFHQKKTEKWLQQLQATAFISFKRMLKTAHSMKQVLIIAREEQINDERAVRLATNICIVSEGLRQLFNEKYPDLRSKTVFLDGVADFTAPEYRTADDIREIIASGREYFVLADFNLTQDSLTTLLKGFSAFKRMLHSSWKCMVILRSEETIRRADVEQLLSNYKYREDVIVTDEELLNEKLRDAYALVSMDDSERLPVPIIEALRVNTPAIVPETKSVRALFGASVAYMGNKTSEAVGEMLMKIYKDENFRQTLIKRLKGIEPPLHSNTAIQTLAGLLK